MTLTTTFADLPVGTRFFPSFGDAMVKTSDTEAAKLSGRKTLYTAPYRPQAPAKRYSEGHANSELMDLSTVKLVPLASVAKGTLIGHVTVDDTADTKRQSCEVAAWYRIHKLTPGTYPVYLGGLSQYGVPVYYAEIPTTITDACLVSLFGGVAYGPDTAGQREIGTTSSTTIGNGAYASNEDSAPFEGRKGFTFKPLENA